VSSALMWRPIVPTQGRQLPFALKKTLSRKLWGTDGSCGGGEAVMTSADIPYLEGLRDAGVDGAEQLIDIINKHVMVALWHEH
jgi:hypothetical protein